MRRLSVERALEVAALKGHALERLLTAGENGALVIYRCVHPQCTVCLGYSNETDYTYITALTCTCPHNGGAGSVTTHWGWRDYYNGERETPP